MFSLRDLRFVLLTFYARKVSWAFYLHYPQINEVGDHIVGTDSFYCAC